MRKLFVGLGMAGLLLVGSSEAIAQKTSTSKEFNERIKALRSRLNDFQAKSVRQTSANLCSDEETVGLIIAQPELKGEKIVEELESRSDVAVTVLFHDPDSVFIPDSLADIPAQSDNQAEKLVVARTPAIAAGNAPAAATEKPSVKVLSEAAQRYEGLRQRVYLATRNARAQAGEVSRQVASLP